MAKKKDDLTPDQQQQLSQLPANVGQIPDLSGLAAVGGAHQGGYAPSGPVAVGAWAPPGGNTEQPAINPPPKGKKGAAASPAATPPPTNAAPSFDPLALQQMWAQVLGPAFNAAAQIGGNVGPDYLNAMTQAIKGSHQSDAAQGTQLSDATAMSKLLQGFAGNQLQQVSAGPGFDQLLQWLQQATGAAQLAQGAAEKSIQYGTNLNAAAAFGVPSAQSATSTNNLSPQQAAALTQQALSGNQTGTVNTANPLIPTALLGAQGVAAPAAPATIP